MSDESWTDSYTDSSHPSDATIVDWVAGKLSAEEAERFESHLEACEACAQRLESLPDTPDPLLVRLRGAAGMAEGLNSIAEAPTVSADEVNLLFGALAIQAGLITAQQLADSCVLWSARGGMPLADVLVEQGWLDESAKRSVLGLLKARGSAGGFAKQARPAAETLPGHASAGINTLGPTTPLADRLRLKQLHSQGGIGQVWLAQDTLLGREVALKELLPDLRGSKKHRDRFFREARVGAQLSHPGTAPVYDYREEGGRVYYTMKFYSGRTFSEAIRNAHFGDSLGRASDQADGSASTSGLGPDSLLELLEQFLSVCDTIAYAHAQGIVHRDLKGENIVLGEFGEVTVIDWGLAKPIQGGSGNVTPSHGSRSDSTTLEGERLGTPGYMAPEQARGDLAAIDERTDVYGLAAVLYELLTTRPPFSGTTANEIMHRVEVDAPSPPSLTHSGTPPELEAICLRGLSKLKEDRQQTAASFRDAVRRWLNDQVRAKHEADRQAKFFALSQDLFVSLDDQGKITQVNPAYDRYFGRDSGQAIGKSYLDSMHPDDHDTAREIFSRVQRGLSQPDTVVRIADAEGAYQAVSWTLTRVPGERTIYAVGRPQDDQSVRRRLDAELSRFFALSLDPCVTFDPDRTVRQVNPAWLEMLGYEEESILGLDCLTTVHPDDQAWVRRQFDRVSEGKSVSDLQMRMRRADGDYLSVNWTLSRVAGEQTMYAIGRQLDEQSERRRSMAAQARFFALSPDLFVISDEEGNAGQINEAWRHVLGWEPEDILGKPFAEYCHPDDIPHATRAGRRALLREAVVNLETRVRTRDGDYRTIAWSLCRVSGDRINYAIGRDITEAKQAEERLRAILDTGPEALVVVDEDGRVRFANKVLARQFGYDIDQIEGQPLEKLIPQEFREHHRQVLAGYMQQPTVRSMGRGAAFPAERADGTRFLVQISLSPLWLSDGNLSILAAVQPVYDEM